MSVLAQDLAVFLFALCLDLMGGTLPTSTVPTPLLRAQICWKKEVVQRATSETRWLSGRGEVVRDIQKFQVSSEATRSTVTPSVIHTSWLIAVCPFQLVESRLWHGRAPSQTPAC